MLRVITLELNDEAPLLDPKIDEAVAAAVASLAPDRVDEPGSPPPGDVVIADQCGRVLRVVQYEVCGETNVVELESIPWW